ncbi:MAG: VRR-NUC domain-containing protein [Bacteroides sp.]|nr:VRR-NUC domain-containing protein [Bacteroides sp.]
MKQEESKLQQACVNWFRYQYPHYGKILIAVPNGGRRDAVTGAKLKKEGAISGVADLLLLVPNRFYGHLAIEMKTSKGCQSPQQKEWQKEMENAGNKSVVCRSLEDFRESINEYLSQL